MDATLEYLKELVDTHGTSGFERDVYDVLARRLKGYGEISKDRLGSFLCEKKGPAGGPRVLPPLQRGHRLIFSPVGAYNNTQWLQFIEYRPNIVLVTEDGQVELIREAEDLSDINAARNCPNVWLEIKTRIKTFSRDAVAKRK